MTAIAPAHVPDRVRIFMNDLLPILEGFARVHDLTVNAYEGAAEDSIVWIHAVYLTSGGHRAVIQVWTDLSGAASGASYIQASIQVGSPPDCGWWTMYCQRIEDSPQIIPAATSYLMLLRETCVLAMPRPGKAHPVA